MDSQETLLYTAIWASKPKVMNYLISHKDIKINKISKKSPVSIPPITVALHINKPSLVVPILKVKGLDVNLVSKHGVTPLEQAIAKKKM